MGGLWKKLPRALGDSSRHLVFLNLSFSTCKLEIFAVIGKIKYYTYIKASSKLENVTDGTAITLDFSNEGNFEMWFLKDF